MDCADLFFANEFPAEFARGLRSVRRGRALSKELAELFAFDPSPALAAFVDLLGAHERANRYGQLAWFGGNGGWTVDWLPGSHNALEHVLEEPFRYPAALAGALAFGCDHGGNLWLVSLEAVARRNEVFLLDHDTDELTLVADSLESFALLMRAVERDGEPPPEEREALHKRTRWRFSKTERATRTDLRARSGVPRRYSATADLRAVLAGDRSSPELAGAPRRRRSSASDVVADLLRLFLRGEEAALRRHLARAEAHPARLVRDAVSRLRALPVSEPTDDPAQFHRLRRLCPWIPRYTASEIEEGVRLGLLCFDAKDWAGVLEACAIPPEDQLAGDLRLLSARAFALQQLGRHEAATVAFDRALAAAPDRPRLWSALCFSLGELQRWNDMRHAALEATRLDPQSSYAHQQLAIACRESGDRAGSITAGRRALELDPNNAPAIFNLSVELATIGDREAQALLQRALSLAPSLTEAAADPELRALFARLR